MATGVTIQVEGLGGLIKRFGSIPANVAKEVDMVIGSIADEFSLRAQDAAPVDTGLLKNLIQSEPVKSMDWKVVSMAPYSAYVEFGTRSSVQVPAGLEAYAAQFKRGSSKGIGMYPRPFFFSQMAQAQKDLNEQLKAVIKEAMSK